MATTLEPRGVNPDVKPVPPEVCYPVYDLTKIGLVSRIVKHRALQFVLMVVNLFFFTVVILTGIFGSPVGNRNFSIIFVWIVWWALLIMLLIPLTARLWCTMCPIPSVGEWVQRLSLVRRRGGPPLSMARTWPRFLRNIWPQNLSFVGVAMFSAIILTRPAATGFLLLGFMVIALGLSLAYKRRAFCRYICPVGGFIGLYSMVAPLEIRTKQPETCLKHCAAECIRGSENSYGCPWMEYPGTLQRNAYCGMCTECLKACPVGNVRINLRPPGMDLVRAVRHLDEAYKGYIMLAAAAIYSTVMLGPWAWMKDAANLGDGDLGRFAMYAGSLVTTMLVVVPGIFLAATWLAKTLAGAKETSLRNMFVAFGYTTVPLGLMGWIAFSLSFVFINGSYALPVVSDPFGWGWDLIGLTSYPWTPYIPIVLPYLQVPTLLVGLMLSILLGERIAREQIPDRARARLSLIPITTLLTAVTALFVWLYIG